jgi:3-oxoacyl-[acyl-carrier protein] reductase
MPPPSNFLIENKSSTVVLITGGTRGLGKAIGMEFARINSRVYLTHRWGSVADDDVIADFSAQDLPTPAIVESDVSNSDDLRSLMRQIQAEAGALDVVISNVAFAKTVSDLSDLRRRALEHSLTYSAWPVVELVQAAQETFHRYPRYIIGISSDGGEVCHPGYDLVGVAKAALETICRYLAVRLKPHGSCVNVIRPGFLDTASARATFGEPLFARLQTHHRDMLLDPHQVAKACVALSSGYMDAVTGQVITVDEGWGLVSPLELLK